MGRIRVAVPVAALAVAGLVIVFAAGLSLGSARGPQGGELGVAIRGEWVVTVKDPGGAVAQEYRFHNAFDGAANIAPILAHASATGRYWLTLSDTGGNNPCGSTSPAACFDFEADDPNGSVPDWHGSLTVTTSSGQVVISSEMFATRNGQFNHVRMLLSRCTNTTAPSACHPGSYGNFSSRTLTSPITVVAGQQILTTVTYSFTAAP